MMMHIRGQKINANFFCTKFFDNPSGHGRPRRKSWTSAPKSAFSCGPAGGEKLFDPGASGRKGQECPREIRTKKFMFMLFFFPEYMSYIWFLILPHCKRILDVNLEQLSKTWRGLTQVLVELRQVLMQLFVGDFGR